MKTSNEYQATDSIQMDLFSYFMDEERFTLKEATNLVKETKAKAVNNESIRARIYEGIDKGIFKRVTRGVYSVTRQLPNHHKNTCLLINGDGRDLSMIADHSVDCIITDHPYKLDEALKGGNRNFATYELFRYEQKDFDEKNRVMKPGCFLVEFLPEESEINFEYLYQVKKMAVQSGFHYFAKVPWKKGEFVANTGRKSKNTEDVVIFSNGDARSLKLDAKKNIAEAKKGGLDIKGKSSYEVRDLLEENGLQVHLMKGTNGMLPTEFNYQPRGKNDKIMEAEKPVELLEAIIDYVTLPDETIMDHFAGSGNLGVAAINKNRNAILIENYGKIFGKMKENVEKNVGSKATLIESEMMTADDQTCKVLADKIIGSQEHYQMWEDKNGKVCLQYDDQEPHTYDSYKEIILNQKEQILEDVKDLGLDDMYLNEDELKMILQDEYKDTCSDSNKFSVARLSTIQKEGSDSTQKIANKDKVHSGVRMQ